jgi:MFS family permease
MSKSLPLATLVVLATINLFNYIDRYIISANLGAISQQLGFAHSDTMKGLLQSAFMVSFVIMAPIFGWLQPHISRTRLIAIGVLLWSLASGASGLAGLARTQADILVADGFQPSLILTITGSYGFLLATRCLVGVGEAAFGPAAPALLSDWFSEHSRGKVMAALYTAVPVGSAMGFAIGGLLGWPWAFFWVVPPGIALALVCWLLPEAPARKVTESHSIPLSEYKYLLKRPSYILNVSAYTAATFCIGGIAYWLPHYVVDTRNAVTNETGTLMIGLIIVVSGLVATVMGSILADRLRPHDPGAYFRVCAWGMYLAFPAMLGMVFIPFPWAWFCLFFACLGLFLNTGPANTILMNVAPPHLRAQSMAICILVIHALGDVISPTLIGVAGDMLPGGLNAGFLIVTGLVLVAGVLWHQGARFLQADIDAAHQASKAWEMKYGVPEKAPLAFSDNPKIV